MCGIFGALNLTGAQLRRPGAVVNMGQLIPYRGPDCGDAAGLARTLGTRHHTVRADSQALHRALNRVTEHLAEPLSDPAILPTYLLAEAASREVKVILTGEGADELFGGLSHLLGAPLG